MTIQNSVYAPTPFAINKGGTGNSTALTNGQVWIGNTGNVPSIGNLTAGAGITVTNGAGSITIASTAIADSTVVLTNPTTSVALQGNTTYITTNTSGGITTFTLPVSPTAGDYYKIVGGGSQGWRVSQNASQQIAVGNVNTTVGTSGNIQSILTGGIATDSIIIYCQSSTIFLAMPLTGQVNVL